MADGRMEQGGETYNVMISGRELSITTCYERGGEEHDKLLMEPALHHAQG